MPNIPGSIFERRITHTSESPSVTRSIRLSAVLLFALLAGVMLAGSIAAQGEVSPFGFGGDEEDNIVQARAVLAASAVAPGDTVDAAVVVTVQPTWHINSSKPYEDFLIPAEVVFDAAVGLAPFGVVYPTPHDIPFGEQTMSVYDGTTVIRFRVAVDISAAEGEYQVPVAFTSQPCNDRTCLAPRTIDMDLVVTVGAGGQPINAEHFTGQEETPERPVQKADPVEQTSDLQRLIDEYGFWGYILALGLAFVTGLLLSFSPCTYPMIPITVSIFAGQQRSVGKGFVLSLFYVGSMAVVYGVMGLIVSLVGGVFGAWLASPPVVIGIAVVFVIFSLSMFGLYELQVPAGLRNKLGRSAQGSGGGVIGAIILGIVAALVVSPCVGPFVAGILVYVATSGSPFVGFLVLFVFALGLGTLFVIIGTFSNAINKLPRSGEWMEQVKKFFGFILLLMAIYFLRTLISPTITAVATAILLIVFSVFGGGFDRLSAESGFFPRLKKLLGVFAFLLGAYLLLGTILTQGFILPPASHWLPAGSGMQAVHEEGIRWETNLETALARAKAEGKPVLIDTWATWCANCKVLEEKTFRHPDVVRAAAGFVAAKVQLERSDSPATIDFKTRFGLRQYSLPTTVLLTSDGSVHRILPGVIEPSEMVELLHQVK